MKHKFLELSKGQKILVLIQLALVALFLLLYLIFGTQQFVEIDDTDLRCREKSGVVTYSGQVEGKPAVFTVQDDLTVEYRLGDARYGPYTIVFDDSISPEDYSIPTFVTKPEALRGVELRRSGETLFRGAYMTTDMLPLLLFDEDGTRIGSVSENLSGEPAPELILELALAPDTEERGEFMFFLLGVLLCFLNVLSILYAEEQFRFAMRLHIRNTEDMEPTDWELFGRWVCWIIIIGLAVLFFINSLNLL